MLSGERLAVIDSEIDAFCEASHWAGIANELRIEIQRLKREADEADGRWAAAHRHNAERDAKIAELEKRIASHVCAGPTTISLTENAAVQEFTAELRRELAEERSHVRQHKVTIEAQGRSIESLREQIYQAQQDAAKSVAPDIVRLQQDLQASETARANAENRVVVLQQFADKPLFDQFERFCNRIIDACREGDAHGTISSMAERALKDMGAPPF